MNLLTENCAIQVKSKHFMAFYSDISPRTWLWVANLLEKLSEVMSKIDMHFWALRHFSPFTVLNYPVKS